MTSKVEWPGWFSLVLPEPWEHEDGGDVISIYDPDGVGAMTVSAGHRSRAGEPTVAEAVELARHFASQRGWTLRPEAVETSLRDGGPLAHATYRESEAEWELWEILTVDRVATVTYVADPADFLKERDAREAIVDSFEWLPSLPRQ